MKKNEDESLLLRACRRGRCEKLIEKYILSCMASSNGNYDTEQNKSKKKESAYRRFPNIAGFCRFCGSDVDELEKISRLYPKEYSAIKTALEDEALNASPTQSVMSSYFKKRLEYEKPTAERTELSVLFEHDIWEDGE